MCIFNMNYNDKNLLHLKKTADIPENKALAHVDSFTALDSSDWFKTIYLFEIFIKRTDSYDSIFERIQQ